MYKSFAAMRLHYFCLAVAALAMVSSTASAVTFTFTAANYGAGNKGESWRPAGAGFTVTARWGLSADPTGAGSYDPNQNPGNGLDENGDPLAGPTPGLVYQDVGGLGVWAQEYSTGKKGGSPELDGGSNAISGGGPHGKEELIFTFDSPVLLDSITVGLVGIETAGKKGESEWSADPLFFITGSAGSEIGISEATLFSIFNSTGANSGYVNFSDLALFTDPLETVSYFRTRNMEGHYEIGFLTYDKPTPDLVPEPSSLIVWSGLAGAFGLVAYRRRRQTAA